MPRDVTQPRYRLRVALLAAGYTLAGFARELGVTRQAVTKVLDAGGPVQPETIARWRAVLQRLGVTYWPEEWMNE